MPPAVPGEHVHGAKPRASPGLEIGGVVPHDERVLGRKPEGAEAFEDHPWFGLAAIAGPAEIGVMGAVVDRGQIDPDAPAKALKSGVHARETLEIEESAGDRRLIRDHDQDRARFVEPA